MLDDVDNVDDETGYSASGQGSNMVVVSRMRAADDDERTDRHDTDTANR